MMKRIIELIAKLGPVLAAVGRNATVDVDTIEKDNGIYLRIRLEVHGFVLVDELAPLDSKFIIRLLDILGVDREVIKSVEGIDPNETRRKLGRPVDIHRSGDINKRRIEWAKDAERRLENSMNRRQ